MTKKRYSPISVRADVAQGFRRLAQEANLENTETLQVCMAAYDIINSSLYGGKFTEAVKKAFAEAAQVG